ncbi:L-2-hydroxyglutarate oxidase [Rapidithrix thailandica]|uniref:L-2-hydroxyglutarate oxidase n=1 Tax=Rapidithrix thailandica TaxID=413964 RepID=A0AAW9S9M9_9BACT
MKYDIVVVGAGIVGLASAYQLLRQQPKLKVAIIEKEAQTATHQTGNNSGVIHSGVYYKPGSLKATNCRKGYEKLLEFCNQEEIPYELCGKIIVATDRKELPALERIYQRGKENGLDQISRMSAEELKNKEPYVSGIEGLWVPYAGIINYKKVAQKIADKIREAGGRLFFNEEVKSIQAFGSGQIIQTDQSEYSTKLLVNCAGLYCDKIAQMAGQQVNVRIIPFRGEYYELKKEKEHLVKNLIYPVPDPSFPFLGVHFTRMMDGGIEAGPNAVLAFKREGYQKTDFDLKEFYEAISWPGFQKVAAKYWQTGLGEMYRSYSKAAFTKALQRLLPEIKEEDLKPGGAGVRAQACDKNGGLLDDFKILEDRRSIHVLNAPSPAATSSLAIGETIADITLKHF